MAEKKIPDSDGGVQKVTEPEIDFEIQLRKSDRLRKTKPEYADFFHDMHYKRLKDDLYKCRRSIEIILEKISSYNAAENIEEIGVEFTKLDAEWQRYKETFNCYIQAESDSSELQAAEKIKQDLGRKIHDCRQGLVGATHYKINEAGSDIAASVSSKGSKRSSVSSKARAAERSAQLAKLRLEQSLRKSEIKRKQIEEQALLEKARLELEVKRAETELREHIQDLRDEVECAQYEAALLAEEEEERERNGSIVSGSTGKQKEPRHSLQTNNGVRFNEDVATSTPNLKPGAGVEGYNLPFSEIPLANHEDNIQRKEMQEGVLQNPYSYHSRLPSPPVTSFNQTFTNTLLQMNHQLISVMQQSADSTAVMKTMLQRQGIPRPNPERFKGDPAQFPVFKQRIQDWLDEKCFTEKERISHLLSFVDGDAKEAIEHCEVEADGYTEAMKILEGQYGHPAKVVRACIKQITEGPKIERGDKIALTKLKNQLQTCLKTLRHNVKYQYEMNASTNIEKVVDRLPLHMQIDWAKRAPEIRDETDTGPDLTHVLSLVSKQVKIMNDPQYGHIITKSNTSRSAMTQGKTSLQPRQNVSNSPRRQVATMATNVSAKTDQSEEKSCLCCNGKHALRKCEAFAKKTLDDRWELVKNAKLCHVCLTTGHMKAHCPSQERCSCKATFLHHKLLHRDLPQRQTPPHQSNDTTPNEKRETATFATLTGHAKQRLVLLHVVPVRIISNEGQQLTTYGLLDNASRGTIISSELATRLNIDGPMRTVMVTTVLGKQECKFKEVSFKLQSADSTEKTPVLTVEDGLVKELSINEKVLPHQIDHIKHPHLSDINIPTVDLKKVSLIIGEDVRNAHIVQEVRVPDEENECDLYATKTVLGWTIAGRIEGKNKIPREVNVNFTDTDRLLREQLGAFWSIENTGQDNETDKSASVEDRRAEKILRETTRLVKGHYETGLLWKEDKPKLPNNRMIAESRLNSLKRKFQRDREFEGKYRKVMQEYVDRGYARKLTPDEAATTTPKTNYLPHHGVTNPNKPGKVRVVFDAAAKFKETSLNKNLLQGPDLSNNLSGVLMRFRQGKIALVADVEGMFHQVKVTQRDQDALRFLWFNNDIDEPPDEYVMTSHIFGATDSPCCANYCLKKTAEDNRNKFDPVVIETVLRNFYVDDMLRALKNEEIAIRVARDLISLLSKGGFRLTKFMSNSRAVLDSIPSKERAIPTLDLDLEDLPIERALGVQWNVEQDTFGFKVVECSKPNTMRGVLSYVSSFYDPQGFAAPVVLPAKQILQECWKRKQTWDETLKGKLLEKWEHWKNLMPIMTQVKIPRCFFGYSVDADLADIQLHHFCDASETGYGTVSYLRMIHPDGTITCSFVQGKSRNVPVRAPTIPRMELQSAVLAVRMDRFIQKELDLPISKTLFWTDSTITLYCIINESKRFLTYVANRINEIREATSVEQWQHCPGFLNPADDCSRGLDAKQFVENKRWLRGPQFLWEGEESWPRHQVEDIPDDKLEIKREKTCLITETKTSTTQALYELLTRYSSWTRLLKSVAWLIKFIYWLKEGRKKPIHMRPTVNDLKTAKRRIVALVQAQSFASEIHDLNQGNAGYLRRVKASSRIVKLKPMMNPNEKILRVSGRIAQAPITYDAKHQMILPQHHLVTELIIRHHHIRLGHCGQEHLLSRLREEFWIVKARATIKKVLGRCFSCKKQHAEIMTQEMADLPKVRVTPYEPPFTYTGIDYFGPLNVKRGRSMAKRYGCIFVCMTTRAIHLELAQSLETDAFIMVLRRFINTRGSVKQLRSDNGTNFVGAERELRASIREWNHKIIEEELQQRDCEWIFHPPGASHMSGVWERLIRGVKRSMKAILGDRTVDEEVLRTVLSEAQGIANSRPLCHNSDDVRDMEALTPNHLLLQRPVVTLPPGCFEDTELSSRKKWRQVQILANHYWKRWIQEYLPTLQERQKWLKPRRDLMVNDLVLIADGNVPRGQWPLGRVTQVYPGRDGLVRSAEVKTKSSVLQRPIRKLCLLEAAGEKRDGPLSVELEKARNELEQQKLLEGQKLEEMRTEFEKQIQDEGVRLEEMRAELERQRKLHSMEAQNVEEARKRVSDMERKHEVAERERALREKELTQNIAKREEDIKTVREQLVKLRDDSERVKQQADDAVGALKNKIRKQKEEEMLRLNEDVKRIVDLEAEMNGMQEQVERERKEMREKWENESRCINEQKELLNNIKKDYEKNFNSLVEAKKETKNEKEQFEKEKRAALNKIRENEHHLEILKIQREDALGLAENDVRRRREMVELEYEENRVEIDRERRKLVDKMGEHDIMMDQAAEKLANAQNRLETKTKEENNKIEAAKQKFVKLQEQIAETAKKAEQELEEKRRKYDVVSEKRRETVNKERKVLDSLREELSVMVQRLNDSTGEERDELDKQIKMKQARLEEEESRVQVLEAEDKNISRDIEEEFEEELCRIQAKAQQDQTALELERLGLEELQDSTTLKLQKDERELMEAQKKYNEIKMLLNNNRRDLADVEVRSDRAASQTELRLLEISKVLEESLSGTKQHDEVYKLREHRIQLKEIDVEGKVELAEQQEKIGTNVDQINGDIKRLSYELEEKGKAKEKLELELKELIAKFNRERNEETATLEAMKENIQDMEEEANLSRSLTENQIIGGNDNTDVSLKTLLEKEKIRIQAEMEKKVQEMEQRQRREMEEFKQHQALSLEKLEQERLELEKQKEDLEKEMQKEKVALDKERRMLEREKLEDIESIIKGKEDEIEDLKEKAQQEIEELRDRLDETEREVCHLQERLTIYTSMASMNVPNGNDDESMADGEVMHYMYKDECDLYGSNLSLTGSVTPPHITPPPTPVNRFLTSVHNMRKNQIIVQIPRYILRGLGRDSYHVFEVKVTIGGETWSVYRRYRKFRELHNTMKKSYIEIGELDFPNRRFFGNRAEEFVRARRVQLETYLKSFVTLCTSIPDCPVSAYSGRPLSKRDLCDFAPFFKQGIFEQTKHYSS